MKRTRLTLDSFRLLVCAVGLSVMAIPLSVGIRYYPLLRYADRLLDPSVATVSCVILMGLSLLLPFTGGTAAFRAILFGKVHALTWYLASTPREPADMLPVLILLLEIAVYEDTPAGILESLAATALSVAGRLVGRYGSLANAGFDDLFLHESGFVAICALEYALARSLVRSRRSVRDFMQKLERSNNALDTLAQANIGYQNYAAVLARRSQEEERLRITREVHDIIGYTLTNNVMMMEAITSIMHKDPEKVRMLLDLERENAATGLRRIRDALYRIRGRGYEDYTTIQKISRLVGIMHEATGIRIECDYGNMSATLGDDLEAFCYSFIQEALTNSFRHGAATLIRVFFSVHEGRLHISVSDNGRGVQTFEEGIGIRGMRERLAALDGSLGYASTGYGFRISAELPYEEKRA